MKRERGGHGILVWISFNNKINIFIYIFCSLQQQKKHLFKIVARKFTKVYNFIRTEAQAQSEFCKAYNETFYSNSFEL